MQRTHPSKPASFLLRQTSDLFPARTYFQIVTLCVADPGSLGIPFDEMTEMLFAFAQLFFHLLAGSNIQDRNRNPDEIACFITGRVIADHRGERFTRLPGRWP